MPLNSYLADRCRNLCELCGSNDSISTYVVPPKSEEEIDNIIGICEKCLFQINGNEEINANYWRCLNESIWSEVPAVQVVSYRILKKIKEDWATDLLNMVYLDESTQDWADSGKSAVFHRDINGHVLANGDNVTLIQDLNVKGASFTAKRGTAVRRIRLVPENEDQIEGKIEGQQIVILTKYVKKN